MKKIFFILAASILILNLALANAHENFSEAKKLVEEKVSCNNLTTEQIEEIGDYLMELMHSGEAHEQMHNMMGGEDSETVKLMHINMAKMMYCNEGEGMNNMMNMMQGGMMSGDMGIGMMNKQTPQTSRMQGMMGSGGMMGMMPMMSMTSGQTPQTSRMQGMMGNWGYFGYWNFINVLYVILLIGLMILVYLWIVNLNKSTFSR